MDYSLTLNQTRVIGVLLEKELTTPDQYPLSLNALTNGCNQKSNREPVLSLSEAEVQDIIDELKRQHMVSEQSGFGSRVVKYKHRFCNTEFGNLKLDPRQLAIVCVLLLRGPQTPGELRTRTNRLANFDNVQDVEASLQQLADFDGGPLVVKLPREAGKRESRYAHLFSGDIDIEAIAAAAPAASSTAVAASNQEQRISELEQQVADLRQELAAIKQELGL